MVLAIWLSVDQVVVTSSTSKTVSVPVSMFSFRTKAFWRFFNLAFLVRLAWDFVCFVFWTSWLQGSQSLVARFLANNSDWLYHLVKYLRYRWDGTNDITSFKPTPNPSLHKEGKLLLILWFSCKARMSLSVKKSMTSFLWPYLSLRMSFLISLE